MTDLTDGELVVKSNALVEASYKLTLVEQQLVLFAICAGREQEQMLTKSSPISVNALDFARQFGLNPTKVYAQLKDATQTLFNRQIIVHDNHPKSGKPRTTKLRWVSEIAYTDGDGLVEFKFSDKVIPYITRLGSEYTRYHLGSVSHMSSVYAIRIYELLSQYLTIGARRFELLQLKEMLGVSNEYSDISDFKKRVLDVAVLQINEHSDIKISYTQEKTGRAVTAIAFSIRKKTAAVTAPKKPKKPVQLELVGVEPGPKKTRTLESDAKRDETLKAVAVMKSKRG